MLPALDTGPLEHGVVGRALVEDLALEDAAVLECKVEDITRCGVRPGIESHHCPLIAQTVQVVPHATQIPMTTE